MAEQEEWYVTDVLARLGNYCLVAWEASDGVDHSPSWIHRKQMRTQGYDNAITRKKGWFATAAIWCPAIGYFPGHPDLPFPNTSMGSGIG